MTKCNPLPRAAATATAALGACLFALMRPPAATAASAPHTGGENTPLNLGPASPGTHASSSGGASIVRTIVGLAIVIAVIWGLTWILRQVKAGRDPHIPTAGLTSVAALTLSTGRSVHLVRAGSEYVLLGSAEHGVVPIHRYTEEEARAAGLLPQTEHLAGEPVQHVAGATAGRYDPTQIPSTSSTLVERLREWTVRR
jgi:flagellar protein FliO/FliZ